MHSEATRDTAEAGLEETSTVNEHNHCYICFTQKGFDASRTIELLTSCGSVIAICRDRGLLEEMKRLSAAECYIWTQKPGADRLDPSSLNRCISLVRSRLELGARTVVLEGVEYLELVNGMRETELFLSHLSDAAADAEGILLILLHENTLEERNVQHLAASCSASVLN
ncbi:MAG: DUF835 domain-containing protein [Methanomassiliicoccales archaeon]